MRSSNTVMRIALILFVVLPACAEPEPHAIPTATPDYQSFLRDLLTATPEPTRTPIVTAGRLPKVYARELFHACENRQCEHRGERVMIQGTVGQNHYGSVVQFVKLPVTSNGRGFSCRECPKRNMER